MFLMWSAEPWRTMYDDYVIASNNIKQTIKKITNYDIWKRVDNIVVKIKMLPSLTLRNEKRPVFRRTMESIRGLLLRSWLAHKVKI